MKTEESGTDRISSNIPSELVFGYRIAFIAIL
jgi:hypothetical protein